MCRVCHGGCVVRLFRMKRRDAAIARLAEHKQAVTTIQLLLRAPRNITVPDGTSRLHELVPLTRRTPNCASHPTLRARELSGSGSYRESLFWAVRSFESRSGRRAPPGGACDHGRPRAAPRQINARSWERHFQRRDAIFVIALLERLQHITYLTAPNVYNTPLPRGPLVS